MTYRQLTTVTVAAWEARERRDRDECGLQEAVRRIRREKVLANLDALQGLLETPSVELQADVLNDLIELMKGMVLRDLV